MGRAIGVLALQGDVIEHVRALRACGADVIEVKRETELDAVEGLVIPGGESTTMGKLLVAFDLLEPLRLKVKDGLPCYGSCAGMIMLADRVLGGVEDQVFVGGMDITVRRNAFGRQVDSFEQPLLVDGIAGDPVHGVFIRAPWVEDVGAGVEVLASVDGHPVAVRQDSLLATSFHPEVTGDARVHALFLSMVAG